MTKIIRAIFLGILSCIYMGSAKAVLWGDTIESKIDVIDQELSILDAAINTGVTMLTSADVVGGNIDLATTGHYLLGESLTADVTITAGCVTLDLNDFCLTGTIVISTDDVTIKDGTLLPPANNQGGAGITISSASDKTRVANLTIQCENQDFGEAAPGKDGIEIAGNDWIVENCTIISGAAGGSGSSRGGYGISLLAAANNVLIRNCLISTGAGGTDGTTGGDGGNGINVANATDVEIADCTIFKTGAGGGGSGTNGDGGNGIFIGSSSTDVSVHNCIIRNTGAAGGGGGAAGVAGKAIDDDVAAGVAASVIFGNFAHNIANSIKFDLQASGAEQGFALSNPPTSTAVSVYANVYI